MGCAGLRPSGNAASRSSDPRMPTLIVLVVLAGILAWGALLLLLVRVSGWP